MKSMMKKIIGVVSIFAIVGLVCAGATFANYETGKIVINDPDSVGCAGTDLYKVDSDSYLVDSDSYLVDETVGTSRKVTSSPSALPVLPAVTDSYPVDETVGTHTPSALPVLPAVTDSYPVGGTAKVGGTAVTSSPSWLPVLPAVTDSYSVDGTVTDPASSSSEPYGTAHWGGAGSTTWSDVIVGEVTDPASLSGEVTDPASLSGEVTDLASSSLDPGPWTLDPVTDPDTVIVHDVEGSSKIAWDEF